MKLLMITGSFPPMPCGVGDYCAMLTGAIAAHSDWEVVVLTDQRAALYPVPVGVAVISSVTDWSWGGMVRLLQLVHKQHPDLVHIQYPTFGYGANVWGIYFLPLLLRICRVKVVQTWHEPASRLRYLANALVATRIIVPEPDYKMLVRSYYRPLIAKRLRYIPVAAAIPCANISKIEKIQLRAQFAGTDDRLLVYFGFAVPMKGIEQLFEIGDPDRDILVLICSLDPDNSYHKELLAKIAGSRWCKRVVVTGFLSAGKVASILAIADSAIFPFPGGVGMRNTSVLAARTQGTFTLTTAQNRHGYDASENVFYAVPGDCASMRTALDLYAGSRSKPVMDAAQSWPAIAEAHVAVYQELLHGCSN